MFEQFFANLGINLLQGKDPLTATKDASISTATGNMFGKAFDSFKVGSEVANQGVQNAEYVNPALSSTANAGAGYTGNLSMMQNPAVKATNLTTPPNKFDARSAYPMQTNQLAGYDPLMTSQPTATYPDYTPVRGTSVDYTGGGADRPMSLLDKAYEKGSDMISNIDAGDVATGGLLYMNKLEKDQQYKDYMNAQRMSMMKGGISRSADKPTPAHILKVKVT